MMPPFYQSLNKRLRSVAVRLATTGLTCMAVVLAARVVLAAPAAYQPAGAPADPKVPAAWNRYRDHRETTALLRQLAAAHPQLCRLESLGTSAGGREMWVLAVTNFANADPQEKSAYWVDGSIHANEIQATEVVLYSAWYVLETYGRSPTITRLLDERVFYFMPIMSPDARDHHLHEANTTHTPRTGTRPRDDDGDGLFEEDDKNDLNADGQITKMRIADGWGRWKAHPDFPHLMIEADADERGQYTLLGDEGYDDDGDGPVSEDGPGFYDPNRQFPWNWQPNYVDRGDRYPLSVQENRLVAEWVLGKPHIAGAQSFHNTGGMITRGPGLQSQEYEGADRDLFDRIAAKGVTFLPGYKQLKTGDGLYEVHGSEDDFFYFLHGTVCFVNELFTSYNYFHKPTAGSYFGDLAERARFESQLLFGSGFVPWQTVSHPTWGAVEVGGWSKNWQRQPPSFMLEEECHRNMAFVLYHADQIPLVEVAEIDVQPLGDDLFQVTAAVANSKMTPTRLAFDVRNRLTPPDRVSISAETNAKVLAGVTSDDRLFQQPREQRRQPATLLLDTLPGMSARYVRWIVKGAGPYEVVIRSTKGGVARKRSA